MRQPFPFTEEMAGIIPCGRPFIKMHGLRNDFVIVDDLKIVDLTIYGPQLQKHPLFPEEANIGAVQLIDSNTLKLSVWERPGVLTTACGTGACVAVGAAHRRGLTKANHMTVIMPTGSVEIERQGDGTVVMTGSAEVSYTGYLPLKVENF